MSDDAFEILYRYGREFRPTLRVSRQQDYVGVSPRVCMVDELQPRHETGCTTRSLDMSAMQQALRDSMWWPGDDELLTSCENAE